MISLCTVQLWDRFKATSKKRKKKVLFLRFAFRRYFPNLEIILKGLTASLAQLVFYNNENIQCNFETSKNCAFINKPVSTIKKNNPISHLCGVSESEKLHAIAEVHSLQPPSLAWLIIPQITNPLISRKSHPHMPAPLYFINMSFLFNTSLSLFALFTHSRHLAKKRWKIK